MMTKMDLLAEKGKTNRKVSGALIEMRETAVLDPSLCLQDMKVGERSSPEGSD